MIERDPRCRHAAGMERGTVTCGLGLFGGLPHVSTCLAGCPVRDRADAALFKDMDAVTISRTNNDREKAKIKK